MEPCSAWETVCGDHAPAYKREPANRSSRARDNAGSDLLSHTAAEHARRPKKWSHAAHGKLCAGTTRRRTNESPRTEVRGLEIMPAATYSPTPPPSMRGGPRNGAMQRMGNCVRGPRAGVQTRAREPKFAGSR